MISLKKDDAAFCVYNESKVVNLTISSLFFSVIFAADLSKSSKCRKRGVQTANHRDAGFVIVVKRLLNVMLLL